MAQRNAAEQAQQVSERQPGDDTTTETPTKKWTPSADPFGFENKQAGKNRVQLLKSEGEKAWVIRFAVSPNDMEGYSKDNPHPVLKMLKDEGYRWGFDGGDGKGGWGKKWSNDPYGTEHLQAREVMAKAAEMIGAAKEAERTPF